MVKVEIKLEGIILAQVWRVSSILKTVVENAEAASGDQFRGYLVCKAKAWSKVRLLRVA